MSWIRQYFCDTCGKEHNTDGDAGWLAGWFTLVLAGDESGAVQKR